MALIVKDRVKETCTGTSGDMALTGAVSGFIAFDADATFDGGTTTTYYALEDADGTKWEVGLGTLSADSTVLTRTTILATQVSFTDTTRQTFSGGAHTIFCTYPAGKSVFLDASGNLSHTVDISADTNLAAGTGITLTGDSLSTTDGDIVHDNLSGFVANEHLDWTTDRGSTNIHAGNYTDTTTNTMGSGFTVSATTDSNATTITQGDDLFFAAGAGITCTTSADGTVTIASTVSDTNTMGSGFVLEDGDGTEVTITENKEVKFIEGAGIDIDWTDVDNGTDADPYDLTFTVSDTTVAGDSGSTGMTPGDTLTIAGGTNATTAMSGDTLTVNVDDAFLINNGSDTTTGTITAGGFTTTGTWTFDTSAGGTTGITNINITNAFTDDDVTLMSAGAIKEKIEGYGYTTNVGDMTGVDLTAGTGITIDSETNTTSGNYSATITCTVTDTNTTYTGGTNLTLSTTTFNVDDAFLVNDADDTTTGIITIDKTSSATNAVTDVLILKSQSSGSPAAGIGAGISFGIETAAANVETGARIEAVVTDAEATNEDIDVVIYTMLSGDTATEALRIHDDGNLTVAGSLTLGSELVAAQGGTGLTSISTLLNSNVDHDALTNFVANEHIDWTASSAGTIHATNYTDTNTTYTKASFDLDHLFTLVDAAADTSENLGTFTGSTIADSVTIKAALQALETAVETKGVTAGSSSIVTVGTIGTGTWQGTAIAGGYIANDAIDSQHYADGSIDTAHIDDNQVTLAKMAGITRGSIIIGDTSGDPAALGIGSNTYVLTSDGTDIAWAAGGGRSVAGDTGNGVVTWVTGDNTFAAEANFQMDGTDLLLTSATASKPVFTIQNTNNGATSGYLKFVNDKGAGGADNDVAGTITFYNDDDAQTNMEFARIEGYVVDASNGTERGGLKLYAAEFNGTVTAGLTLAGGAEDDGLTLTTNAGIVRKVATKVDTNYTMTATDHIVLVDTSADDRTITLPTASADNIGQEYTIKKIDSGVGVVNITPASTGGYGPDDIDEYDTKFVLYAQHDSVTFVCGEGDATAGDEQWWIISEKTQPHCAQMVQEATQSIAQNSNVKVDFPAVSGLESFAIGCTADASNNRITITRPGQYLIGGGVSISGGGDSTKKMDIKLKIYDSSAGASTWLGRSRSASNFDGEQMQTTSCLADLASDDYIEVYCYHNFGGAKSTIVGTDNSARPFLFVSEIKS